MQYLRDGAEEGNIRGLVESCAHNDDVTPLVKLVFEAQALADTTPSIVADGQTMVSIISGALQAVADDQAAVVEDVCHSNATAIAHTVAELEQMHHKVEVVKETLLAANAGMQAAGNDLVCNVQHTDQLQEVQENLHQATSAVQAAQAVLEQCLIAGELIEQQQLYPALCMLDKIRRKHLGSLLSMLSGTKPTKAGSGSSSSTAAAVVTGAGPGSSRQPLTVRDLEHVQQLHIFFNSLVDDLSANVQRLALRGFNAWLVSMRACAREVGVSAIQSASVERSLEDHLAGERKTLLAAVHGPGAKSVRDIAAELGTSGFRQELLKAAADEAAAQAANKAGASGGGAGSATSPRPGSSSSAGTSTAGGADGRRSTGGGGGGAEGGGMSFTAASASLRDLLKRPSIKESKMPRQVAAAAEAAALRHQQQLEEEQQYQQYQQYQRQQQQHQRQQQQQQQALEQQAAAEEGDDGSDLDELFPGEPDKAVRELIDRGDRRNSERARRERHRRRQQQQQQQEQRSSMPLSADPSGGLKGLMQVDMKGLYTAVHVAKSLGQLDTFRQHYLDQRRLQITADLQPPFSFLQAYQAYLSQVTGFFVLESFVSRVTDDLMGPQEAAQLWGVALRSLKGVLESAFEQQLSSAPEMLQVKGFVVLMCVALERAGHQVTPMTEVLRSTCGRYHDLLAADLQARMSAAVESDVLGELDIRTPAQHRQVVDDYCLPWQLEGAGTTNGRRVQLGADGVPPLPYVAPFTVCVPELLDMIRDFILESLTYLRDLYSPWELLPAVFHQRDRMLSKVLVEVLSSKARAVGAAELLRESMKCATNAWALGVALDGLDDWTLSQIRPDAGQPEVPRRESGAGAAAGTAQQAAAAAGQAASAAKASRVRHRKAVLASGALTNTVQTALKALQESSERDVLHSLTTRIEQLLEGSRRADWAPAEPLPSSQSPWVNALLSYLQEIFDTGIKLLPRSSVVSIMRMALRATAIACMRTFSPDGVKAFNMYAVEKLAHNLLTIERFASRWGVDTLDQELAEPTQLCKLLLSGRPDAYAASLEVRQHYPALPPSALVHALERYKEVPGQAKKKPDWASKKTADAALKQLKAGATGTATAAPGGGSLRAQDFGEGSPGRLGHP